MKDYGAKGDWDGTDGTDDTDAIQAALTAAAGGTVLLPEGRYKITSSLVPPTLTRIIGNAPITTRISTTPPVILDGGTMTDPVIDATVKDVTIENIAFFGKNASGSKGIHTTDGSNWLIRDCFFNNFGDQAIHMTSGAVCRIENVKAQNAVLIATGRSDYVGVIDVQVSDCWIVNCEAASLRTGNDSGSGYVASFVFRSNNSWLINLMGELSETGFAFTNVGGIGSVNKIIGCRADLNYADGFVVGSVRNQFVGCHSYRNGQATDNTYDGFKITAGENNFVGCHANGLGSDSKKMRYGFNDSAGAGSGAASGNSFQACRGTNLGTGTFNLPASTNSGYAGLDGRVFTVSHASAVGAASLTYGATISTDAGKGNYFKITVTNSTAPTISNPTNLTTGQQVTYDILNSSGGAMGTITWGATFKLAGSFTNPANGKHRTISFYYDGTNLIETHRAAADI